MVLMVIQDVEVIGRQKSKYSIETGISGISVYILLTCKQV